MQTASSAKRTCRLWRSGSESTATVRMPSSLQAQTMRRAISPRLAIRIFLIGADGKQRLPVLHGLSVHHQLAFHDPGNLGLDLVHELHGLDDAQDLADLHALAYAHERRRAGRGGVVKRADD